METLQDINPKTIKILMTLSSWSSLLILPRCILEFSPFYVNGEYLVGGGCQ